MNTRRDIGKKLRDGITARLEFDFACERGHSFGEYHLHGVINEIVSAIIDPGLYKLHGGYPHPALALPDAPRAGRRREVDFYVENRDTSEARTCIEAKWAGSSHAVWDRVLLDLCRLTLVKHYSPTVECLFVLSGTAQNVNNVLRSMPLVRQGGSGSQRHALQLPDDHKVARQRVFEPMTWTNPKILREKLPSVPAKIHSTLLQQETITASKWETIVWRIG